MLSIITASLSILLLVTLLGIIVAGSVSIARNRRAIYGRTYLNNELIETIALLIYAVGTAVAIVTIADQSGLYEYTSCIYKHVWRGWTAVDLICN